MIVAHAALEGGGVYLSRTAHGYTVLSSEGAREVPNRGAIPLEASAAWEFNRTIRRLSNLGDLGDKYIHNVNELTA